MKVRNIILSSVAIVTFGYIALFCHTIDRTYGLFKRLINGHKNKEDV